MRCIFQYLHCAFWHYAFTRLCVSVRRRRRRLLLLLLLLLQSGQFCCFCDDGAAFSLSVSRVWFRWLTDLLFLSFGIISFVLYDYYPLGVSFLFYFANSTCNYRATLPIKRAKKEENIVKHHNRNADAPTTTVLRLRFTITHGQMLITFISTRIKTKNTKHNPNERNKKGNKPYALFSSSVALFLMFYFGRANIYFQAIDGIPNCRKRVAHCWFMCMIIAVGALSYFLCEFFTRIHFVYMIDTQILCHFCLKKNTVWLIPIRLWSCVCAKRNLKQYFFLYFASTWSILL